jgi:hypothetical protein
MDVKPLKVGNHGSRFRRLGWLHQPSITIQSKSAGLKELTQPTALAKAASALDGRLPEVGATDVLTPARLPSPKSRARTLPSDS